MSNRPIKTYKAGGIQVAIWSGDYGNSVSLKKSYKDKSGEWKETSSLSPGDALVAAGLLTQAANFLINNDANAAITQSGSFSDDDKAF